MELSVKKIGPQLWSSTFSEHAHLGVFGEFHDRNLDRIDYALLCINKEDEPVAYMTCRELDSESVYWQYGGVFGPYRNSVTAFRACESFTKYHRENYKRCATYIENTNTAMLKVALKLGFKISGIRNFKNSVLVEHLLEFGGENGNKVDIQ